MQLFHNRSHKINLIFKSCAPLRDCIKGNKSRPINYATDLDVVMPMHNFIEYNNNYLKHQEVYGHITEISQVLQY